ncbi:MAG: DUF2569 domain-containing protein [Anaerolineae bacterium]|nr:DUF2569 domain-containing protein [Anaerolineae bacterium]
MNTNPETSSHRQTNQPPATTSSAYGVEPQGSQGKAGIGGCLIYPLLFLVVQPIAFLWALSALFRSRPYLRYEIYWPNAIADVITLSLTLAVLVMFLRKKRIVPALFVGLLAFLFVLWAGMAFILLRPAGTADPIGPFMVLFLQCFILIPYLTLSGRVKNTFVGELDSSSSLDRLFIPIASPLERFYGWLVRIGKWVFLLVLSFVTVVIGINVVIALILGRSL